MKFLVIGPEEHDQNDAISHAVIERLRAQGLIQFHGWSNDIAAWYSVMDAFALPSYREGIPRACMEAAAMQLPVIATDIRGCREVVQDGQTGILVPVRNVDGLVDAILKLCSDRELAATMGAAGSRRIRIQFDEKIVAARLRDFYSSVDHMLSRVPPDLSDAKSSVINH